MLEINFVINFKMKIDFQLKIQLSLITKNAVVQNNCSTLYKITSYLTLSKYLNYENLINIVLFCQKINKYYHINQLIGIFRVTVNNILYKLFFIHIYNFNTFKINKKQIKIMIKKQI